MRCHQPALCHIYRSQLVRKPIVHPMTQANDDSGLLTVPCCLSHRPMASAHAWNLHQGSLGRNIMLPHHKGQPLRTSRPQHRLTPQRQRRLRPRRVCLIFLAHHLPKATNRPTWATIPRVQQDQCQYHRSQPKSCSHPWATFQQRHVQQTVRLRRLVVSPA